jgi:hypothetical protein
MSAPTWPPRGPGRQRRRPLRTRSWSRARPTTPPAGSIPSPTRAASRARRLPPEWVQACLLAHSSFRRRPARQLPPLLPWAFTVIPGADSARSGTRRSSSGLSAIRVDDVGGGTGVAASGSFRRHAAHQRSMFRCCTANAVNACVRLRPIRRSSYGAGLPPARPPRRRWPPLSSWSSCHRGRTAPRCRPGTAAAAGRTTGPGHPRCLCDSRCACTSFPLPQGQGSLRDPFFRGMIFYSQPRQCLVDQECGYPYTFTWARTQTGIAMNQIKIGKRIVVIAGAAPAHEALGFREPIAPRPKARRIVVIRNGQSVARKRGR